MILSGYYTYLVPRYRRRASLSEDLAEKLLTRYKFNETEDLGHAEVQEIYRAAQAFGKQAPLVTEWVLASLSHRSGVYPQSLPDFIQRAHFYFQAYNTPEFRESVEEYAEYSGFNLNPRNLLSFDLTDMAHIWEIYNRPKITLHRNKLQGGLPQGTRVIHRDSIYQILEVTTPDVACHLGKGTGLCTRHNDSAQAYLNESPLYVIYKYDEKYAQMHVGTSGQLGTTHLMNMRNQEINLDDTLRESLFQSGLLPQILNRVNTETPEWVFLHWVGTRPPEYLQDFISSRAVLALHYSVSISHGRWAPGEPSLLREGGGPLFYYVVDVIKDRWPEAEPKIIHSGFLDQYVKFVSRLGKFKDFVRDNDALLH